MEFSLVIHLLRKVHLLNHSKMHLSRWGILESFTGFGRIIRLSWTHNVKTERYLSNSIYIDNSLSDKLLVSFLFLESTWILSIGISSCSFTWWHLLSCILTLFEVCISKLKYTVRKSYLHSLIQFLRVHKFHKVTYHDSSFGQPILERNDVTESHAINDWLECKTMCKGIQRIRISFQPHEPSYAKEALRQNRIFCNLQGQTLVNMWWKDWRLIFS